MKIVPSAVRTCLLGCLMAVSSGTVAADQSAWKDYLVVYDMSTCSAYYAFRMRLADSDSEKAQFRAAEDRVFQRMGKAVGKETAVQMSRASWNTWQLLSPHVSDASWDRLWAMLNERCLQYQ